MITDYKKIKKLPEGSDGYGWLWEQGLEKIDLPDLYL
jgi:hypothetical protein